MLWKTLYRTFDLAERGLIMGVLNVTPDSFSDGGRFFDRTKAIAHALEMAADGAEIIDVGGESTRPNATPISEAEELARVLPVIAELHRNAPQIAISIDTMKPAVARAAVAAGAEIVNDVTGLRSAEMRAAVRETGAAAILMHMRGTPSDMQQAPVYKDVCGEIREFFRQGFSACLASEIDATRLAFDPGIGFGKTVPHNLAILRELGSLRIADRPLVLGVSRKSFIGKVLGSAALQDREWPTVALTSHGRTLGANIVRVHDVRANVHAMRMTEAILAP